MKNKKAYTKPEIYMEEFGVSQSIATCDIKTNTFYKDGGCGIPSTSEGGFDEPVVYFNKGIGGSCTHDVTLPDGDKTCYHIPQSYAAYFGS